MQSCVYLHDNNTSLFIWVYTVLSIWVQYYWYCSDGNDTMIAVCSFWNMTEDLDKTVRVQVPMTEELRNKFKSVTAAKGKTMSEVILNFVKDYVEDKNEEKQAKSK